MKKAVNLSIDSGLLEDARSNGINLSATLEHALAEEKARRWLVSNRGAIAAYNESLLSNGVWSDGWRQW
jgi:antitoxin CcdA